MAVLISAVSCSIEENKIDPIPADPRVPMTFTAGEFTKTSLDPDKENAVHWSAGDAISIFDGTNNNEFTLTEGAGTASAKFEGEAVPDKTYYALYPYSETASLSGTTITSSLPAEQQYVGATFDTMLNPSVAVADGDNNLAFHNVASILQINVSGLPNSKSVREIQISADKSLTGEYTVAMSNTEPYAAVASTGTEISGLRLLVDSADMEPDPNLNGSISCYAVVLPGTYANLKISVIYSDNSYSEKSFENVTLAASDGKYVNVDASQATANDRGLYGLFMAGQDIYIGGKAYNKSQFTDSTPDDNTEDNIKKVINTNSTIYAGSSLLGDGKIIFVDIQEQKAPLKIAAAGDIIVVGNDPENKPIVNRTVNTLQSSNTDNSRLILANLKIDLQDTETPNIAFSPNSTFGELVFDNCEILMHESKYLVGITNASHSIDKIVFTNCDIRIPAGTENKNRYIVHTGTVDTAVKEVEFTNNVLYCPADYIYNFRAFSGNTYDTSSNVTNSTDIESLVFNNNTLVNLRYQNSALLVCDNISYAEISKNIVYFNQSYSANNSINFLIATTSYPTSAECSDNIVYDSNVVEGVPAYNMFYHSQYNNGVLGSNPVVLTDSPLQDTDFEKGIFTPTSEYASYGAQR